VATLLAAFIAYLIGVWTAGLNPAPLRFILLVGGGTLVLIGAFLIGSFVVRSLLPHHSQQTTTSFSRFSRGRWATISGLLLVGTGFILIGWFLNGDLVELLENVLSSRGWLNPLGGPILVALTAGGLRSVFQEWGEQLHATIRQRLRDRHEGQQSKPKDPEDDDKAPEARTEQ
jgi:hypothetical protein